MRIVAGKLKGIKLAAPVGRDTTRPTADKARESLFNVLDHGKYSRILRGSRIVDVFSGTGALGLEAISRGAKHVAFFERDKLALAALNANITKCKMDDICQIFKSDALRPQKVNTPYDVLFFDPPYYQDLASQSTAAFAAQGWMADDSLSIIQIHPKDPFTAPSGFEIIDERKYGVARFLFMAKAS